jgi:dihydroneopterin aldolase/2-amino-4-hydroxy-6-hydroxymethyldihydropteridine diphosphokinase
LGSGNLADKIIIENLECFAKHGVLPEENVLGQKFIVSAELYTDFGKAVENDDLTKSVNYAEVCSEITDFMKNNTFALIETVAEEIANLLLTKHDINGVKVKIKKPWAPIGLPLEYAGVEVERKWHKVYISFGSNMGEREKYIEDMLNNLKADSKFKITGVSDIIETEPYGYTEQGKFLNGVLSADTLYSPQKLLDFLHSMETAANRKREIHWGPRTLDLDILLYDDEVIYEDNLIVPHIDMENRLFVLEPLAQLAPYAKNPLNGKTAIRMLKELKNDD